MGDRVNGKAPARLYPSPRHDAGLFAGPYRLGLRRTRFGAAVKNAIFSISSLLILAGCGNNVATSDKDHGGGTLLQPLAPEGWADAESGFINTSAEPTGFVAIAESPAGGILMRVDLMGLSKGWHGIHLHQTGDCSDHADGFKASGGHFNPDNREHGLLNPNGPEAADLPNIYAGADGRATAEMYNAMASLTAGPTPLMDEDGFAIVVHANADDHETQPIGGAGPRVACAALTGGP